MAKKEKNDKKELIAARELFNLYLQKQKRRKK